MKSLSRYLLASSLAFVLACEDEPETLVSSKPVTIQFEAADKTLPENGEKQTIALVLTRPAPAAGIVKVKLSGALLQRLVVSPAPEEGIIELAIAKGAARVSFDVTPVNNASADGNADVQFALLEVTNGFQIGVLKDFSLQIQDDEDPGATQHSYAEFGTADFTIRENSSEWHEVRILLSESTAAKGAVVLKAASEKALYGSHYVTEPAFGGGELTLPVNEGAREVSFRIRPVNDEVIAGDLNINMEISETSGDIRKGAALQRAFRITDDELENLPKGYVSTGGGWELSKIFEYNADGSIGAVHWESHTPYKRTSTDRYYYDAQGQVTRVNKYPGQDLYYYFEGGRVVREEKIDHGTLKSYTEYGYDDAGNVGATRTFHLQSDGQFKEGLTSVMLYHTDGNLYKLLVYSPTSNPEEPYLVSTTTYGSYRQEPNAFPMVEVLPNVNVQKNLPGSYRYETPDADLSYNLRYEFRSDGKPTRRIATQGATTEVAVYHYY